MRRDQRLAQEHRRDRGVLLHRAGDAYAARTGRPRERRRHRRRRCSASGRNAISIGETRREIAAVPPRPRSAAAPQDAGASDALRRAQVDAATPAARGEIALRQMPAPAPLAKIGTGHGRSEQSYVQTTRFERESATPNETIAIQYDRRENLIAMGVLPPPVDRADGQSVSRVDAAVRAGSADALS